MLEQIFGRLKGQIAFEFLVVYTFVIILFIVIFLLIAAQRSATLNSQQLASEQLVAQDIAGYMDQALYAGSGYNVTVPLVPSIGATPYTVIVSSSGVVIVNSSTGSQATIAEAFSNARNLIINGTVLSKYNGSVQLFMLPIEGSIRIANLNGIIYVDQNPAPTAALLNYMALTQVGKGQAALFTGASTNSFAVDPALSSVNSPLENATSFTITAWIDNYGLGSNSNEIIYSEASRTSNGPSLVFGVNASGTYVCTENNGIASGTNKYSCGYAATPVSIPQHQWSFVAVTLTGGGISKGVFGGYLDTSNVFAVTTGSDENTIGPFAIGVGSNSANYINAPPYAKLSPWNGLITNVQVYNTSLSATSLNSLYAQGITSIPSISINNLVAWYRFLGNGGDSSGSGWTLYTQNVSYQTVAQLNSQAFSLNGLTPNTGLGSLTASLTGFLSTGGTFGSNGIYNASYSSCSANETAYLTSNGFRGVINVTAFGFNGNATFFSNCNGASQSTKLVGWWPGMDGTGTVVHDFSGFYRSPTFPPIVGNYPQWTTFNLNSTHFLATKFTSGYQALSQPPLINSITVNNTFTVVSWIYLYGASASKSMGIFGNIGSTSPGFQVDGSTEASGTWTAPLVVDGIPVGWPTSTTNFPTGGWEMVTAEYNGNSGFGFVYLNNILYATNSLGANLALSTSTTPVIGTNAKTTTDEFNGLIANVQLYSSFLNQSQINYIYSQGVPGAPIAGQGLIGWWPLGSGVDQSTSQTPYTKPGSASFVNQAWNPPNLASPLSVITTSPVNGNAIQTLAQYALIGGNTLTVAAWFDPNQSQNGIVYNPIFSIDPALGAQTANGLSFGIQKNGIPYYSAFADDNAPSVGPRAYFNGWNFMAAILNGTSISMFLDGEWKNGTLPAISNVRAGNIMIGASIVTGPITYIFNGSIADVQLYNAILTPIQVKQLYQQGIPGIVKLNVTTTS